MIIFSMIKYSGTRQRWSDNPTHDLVTKFDIFAKFREAFKSICDEYDMPTGTFTP